MPRASSLSPTPAPLLSELENEEEGSFHGIVSPFSLLSAKDVFEHVK